MVNILNANKTDNFIRLAREITALQVIILFEGKDDIGTTESLINKLDVGLPHSALLTDCGGVSKLEECAPYISTLCRVSKRTRKIAMILDANGSNPQQRAKSLKQSLESHNVTLENFHQVTDSIYSAIFERFDILIKAVGKMELPFKRHEMEDYAVQLLLLNGDIKENQFTQFVKASDFIEEYGKKAAQIIEESEESDVREAYKNILDLLNRL